MSNGDFGVCKQLLDV